MDGGNWKEMFAAACAGELELVWYHVDHGVDINYAHPEFLSTPLVASALAGHQAVALYLLDAGANPHLRSEFDGLTPLQAAQRAGLATLETRLRALGATAPAAVPLSDAGPGPGAPGLKALELKVPPLALCLAFAVAIAAVAQWVPAASGPFPGQRALAAGLLLCGLAVGGAAVWRFRQARTSLNPLQPGHASAVVATGVLRYSRNPMYLGMALGLLGVSTWFATLAGPVLVLLFCAWMTRFQIQPEERALLARFGPAFAAYMASVRRWL